MTAAEAPDPDVDATGGDAGPAVSRYKAEGAEWARVRTHAEQPSAEGDDETTLDRWREVWSSGRFAVSIVFVLKYLLRLERRAEADELARAEGLAAIDDPWLERAILKVLTATGLEEPWDAAAERMVARPPTDDFPRRRIDESLTAVASKIVALRDFTDARARRLTALIGPLLDAGAFDGVPEAARARFCLAAMCRIDDADDVARLDRLLDGATASRLATMPGDPVVAAVDRFAVAIARSRHLATWFAFVRGRVLPELTQAARLRLLTQVPAGPFMAPAVVPELRAASAAERPWHRARLLEHVFSDPRAFSGPEIAALLERAGDGAPTGLVGLLGAVALAGFSPRALRSGLDTARRMMAMAAWRECAIYLGDHRHRSQTLSETRAFALAALARDPLAMWEEIPEPLRGRRVRTAHAFTLAEGLDTAGGLRELDALPPPRRPAEAVAAWRDRLRFHRLVGDIEAAAATLADPPADCDAATAAEERLRQLFETGDFEGGYALVDGLEPEVADAIGIRRVLAHQSQVDHSPEHAVDLWRAIDQRTGTRADRHCLVMALYAAGRFDEARVCAELSLRDFPGDGRFAVKAAQGFERAGDFARALDHYVAAAERPLPDAHTAFQGIARCLIDLERWDDAVDWLESLPRESPDWLWAHGHRAVLEARRGDDAAAGEAYRRMRTIAARARERIEARTAREPAMVWTGQGFVPHPHPAAAAHERHWGAVTERLRAARSVALVGNGPSLAATEMGGRIDAHDHVVRLNDFVIDGFEAHVGSRTDLWISSANRLAVPGCQGFEAAQTLLLKPQARHYPDLVAHVRSRLRLDVGSAAVGFMPVHWQDLTTALGYARPSTGFRTIMMLEFVADVDYTLYGFNFFHEDRLHYFEEKSDRLQVGEVHAVTFERDFATMVLARHGRLRFADAGGSEEIAG